MQGLGLPVEQDALGFEVFLVELQRRFAAADIEVRVVQVHGQIQRIVSAVSIVSIVTASAARFGTRCGSTHGHCAGIGVGARRGITASY